MNQKAIKAMQEFLEAIGIDLQACGMEKTPERVAGMYEYLFNGMGRNTDEVWGERFTADNDGIVAVKDIPFYSMCEHHMMPFYGKAHIAYIPDGKVVGISKLARTVEVYARRLQLQERLCDQIADALFKELKPKGVMVMLEAEHMCMTMRGIKKPGTKTVTVSKRGDFADDDRLQDTFFNMLSR